MRTKSFRIASAVSSSTIRVPVRPPARPVATTGMSSRFSARAMLIPLPPASVSTSLARWRWPRWKFGTVSVRSSAALSVTVTITRRDLPGGRAGARLPDSVRRDERRAGDHLAAVENLDLAEPLTLADRKLDLDGSDDALDERALDMDHAQGGLRRDEADALAAVRGARARVDAPA